MVSYSLARRIRELPDRPGIYVFQDADSRPLYVGKAASLRKRGASYLAAQHEARIETMLQEAVDVEFVVTDTEAEALLLENNWIKGRRPRYNILLRDDKTYPYVKLTLEDYPRVTFSRRLRQDGGARWPIRASNQSVGTWLVQQSYLNSSESSRICRRSISARRPLTRQKSWGATQVFRWAPRCVSP